MMHTMSDHPVLPFDGMGLYPQPRSRLMWKVPKVVSNQKAKFENNETLRKLSRECEIRYTGYRDRPLEERQRRFQDGCREGHAEISFAATGTNIQLTFGQVPGNYLHSEPDQCDFEKERGKVHVRSHFVMDGVCVTCRGWIDLQRLDGVACLEFDDESAARENVQVQAEFNYFNRLRMVEEKQPAYRSGGGGQPPHLNHHHHHHVHHNHHVAGSGTGGGGGEPHGEMEVGLRAY